MTSDGKARRLKRILGGASPCVMLPLDDALISGPSGWNRNPREILEPTILQHVDCVLGFRGLLSTCHRELVDTAFVMNLSGSTSLGDHTRKTPVTSVETAVAMGADGVVFHINCTSESENAQLEALGRVGDEADRLGMPLLVISYPRRSVLGRDDNYSELRRQDPVAFEGLVTHCVRIAVELGAAAVKTIYTGSVSSFRRVIDAALGIPVITAGGGSLDINLAVRQASECVEAGSAGIAFGRAIFLAPDPRAMVEALAAAVGRESE